MRFSTPPARKAQRVVLPPKRPPGFHTGTDIPSRPFSDPQGVNPRQSPVTLFHATGAHGVSYSPGYSPFADLDRAHHPANPSRRSSRTDRRPFKTRPQGMPPAKVRCHRWSIASPEDPRPSRALNSSSVAFCQRDLEPPLHPRQGALGSSSVHVVASKGPSSSPLKVDYDVFLSASA